MGLRVDLGNKKCYQIILTRVNYIGIPWGDYYKNISLLFKIIESSLDRFPQQSSNILNVAYLKFSKDGIFAGHQ